MTYNAKSKEATLKYRAEHIKRVTLDLQVEEYNKIKKYSTERGETVSGFIKRAIRETMLSDY